ncbi:MAG: S-layer homology domain-containing protein [Clostridia bacterium]|nr:S-layer homology domain-containing protein [Clostridia bacterium]
MKKIIFLLLSLVMFTALAVGINAGTDYIKPNPPITVEITTPTVDGNITKTEGWSAPIYMNEDTLNYRYRDKPLTIWAEVRFAMDMSGVYFCADIYDGISVHDPNGSEVPTDNGFVPSIEYWTGALIGDKFTMNLDPLGIINSLGPMAGTDVVPAYSVRMLEGGQLIVDSLYDRPNETLDTFKAECRVTENGWCFEVFIGWDEIIEDFNDIIKDYPEYTNGDITLDINDIICDTSLIKAGCIYEDWYYDDPENYPEVYNVYTTASETRIDGRPGYGAIREVGSDSLGIDINFRLPCSKGGHRWSDWIRIKEPTYFEKGRDCSLCNRCGDVIYRDVDILEYRNTFTDVKGGSWYAEGVKYCVMKGYMSGMNKFRFEPNSMLTREQCVLILANLFDVDTAKYKNKDSGFKDVPTGKWYSGAIAWSKQSGIISGMSEDTFGRGQYIKRDAFARILYVAADHMGMPMKGRADLSRYVDYNKVQDWAYDELAWAVVNGIITSTKDDVLMLSPRDEVKRSQCATMLWQMGELYDKYLEMGLIEDKWR